MTAFSILAKLKSDDGACWEFYIFFCNPTYALFEDRVEVPHADRTEQD
jgi:hypothetical protein